MDLAQAGKRLAKLSLIWQLSLVIVLSTVFFLFYDLSSAISVVIGGTLSVVINAVFAFFTFRFSGASKNQQVVNSMKRGLKIKLFISICAFFIIFQIPLIQNLEAVFGFSVVMISQYPILLTLHRNFSQKAV